MAIVKSTDRPADHKARVEVEHRGKMELPATADHELRRITDPSLVRGRGHEVLTEDIRRDGLGMITQRGALEPSPHPRRQPLGLF